MIELNGQVAQWVLHQSKEGSKWVKFGVLLEDSETEPLLFEPSFEADQVFRTLAVAKEMGRKGQLHARISIELSAEVTDNGQGD